MIFIMRKSILVALTTLVFLSAFAQRKDVAQIRRDYNVLKAWIAKLPRMGNEGGMYCLTVDDNPYDSSYPGVGHFRTRTQFYYHIVGGEPPVLRMAIESHESGSRRTYTEAMFDEDGKATFIFFRLKLVDDKSAIERRLYMDGGNTLSYTENNKPVTGPKQGQSRHDVWIKADRLMKQFMGAMEYSHK